MSNPYQPYPQGQPGGYGQEPYPRQGYLQGAPIGFGGAIAEGLKNLVTFNGRASRPAFWWYALFLFIIDVILQVATGGTKPGPAAYAIDGVMLLLTLAVAVRRLHDTGKSGFWWLLGFIPIIGGIILIVFYCMPGTPGPNKYDQ